jgi:predicted enzyme related to lactoylglutathione lyase
MSQGIPATAFQSDDLDAEVKRLKAQGVRFTTDPVNYGDTVRLAVFADSCGNLIQVYQPLGA